jgi:hypothetical protein
MPNKNPRAARAMLNRRMASVRFRLNHPDYYVASGAYTPAQRKHLQEKIKGMEAERDKLDAEVKKADRRRRA